VVGVEPEKDVSAIPSSAEAMVCWSGNLEADCPVAGATLEAAALRAGGEGGLEGEGGDEGLTMVDDSEVNGGEG